MNEKSKDYYDELGVSRDATDEQIRQAFRRRAKQVHPDRKGGSNEAMATANRAAEVLLDPKRRLTYDRTGEDKPDQLESSARERLAATILNWIANIPDDLPYGINLPVMAEVTKVLLAEERQHTVEINKAKKLSAKFRKHIKRIRYKGKGKTILLLMLDSQLRNLDQTIGQSEEKRAVITRAIELSKDFDYEDEKSDIYQGIQFHAAT